MTNLEKLFHNCVLLKNELPIKHEKEVVIPTRVDDDGEDLEVDGFSMCVKIGKDYFTFEILESFIMNQPPIDNTSDDGSSVEIPFEEYFNALDVEDRNHIVANEILEEIDNIKNYFTPKVQTA